MATQIKKGQSVFFLFKDGKTMYDSQMKPRMYLTRKGYEQHTRTPIEIGAELIEYAPARHGKWNGEGYECSECGYLLCNIMDADSYFSSGFSGVNYCPNCGAKMDLE